MELFYGILDGDIIRLTEEESLHCVKVMRHRSGDTLDLSCGDGNLYHAVLEDASVKGASARITSVEENWGDRPYRLTIGCCPTKNNERFEWFVEKATEIGADSIVPLIGDRSERKVYKVDRARRIALSAAKQSLKTRIPEVPEPVTVKSFLEGGFDGLGLIACCFDGEAPRRGIREALAASPSRDVCILIGPEGDFSPEEVALAIEKGFVPVHLGSSRLRTETAAVYSAAAVYLMLS